LKWGDERGATLEAERNQVSRMAEWKKIEKFAVVVSAM